LGLSEFTNTEKQVLIACLQNKLPFHSNNPLLVEDLILSFDKQAHFPNLFLLLPTILRKVTHELFSVCADVQ
jgi:hypothetical protein